LFVGQSAKAGEASIERGALAFSIVPTELAICLWELRTFDGKWELQNESSERTISAAVANTVEY